MHPRIWSAYAALSISCLLCSSVAHAQELPRRGLFGAGAGAISAEKRESLKLGEQAGIIIERIIPGSPAASAGLKPDDVITRLNETAIASPDDFVGIMRRTPAGTKLKVGIIREGKPQEVELTTAERPAETSTEHDVIYGHVKVSDMRIRTYITKPKGDEKRPAVLMMLGLGNGPLEFAQASPQQPVHPFKQLIDGMTKQGYVTMRVDRPGVGDSDGGMPADQPLSLDIETGRAALKALAALPYVDSTRVFVYGHSAAGTITPLIVEAHKVAGVVTFAAAVRPTIEVVPALHERMWKLEGIRDPELSLRMDVIKKFFDGLLVRKQTPDVLLAENPSWRPMLEQLVQQDRYVHGRHYSFLRDLGELPLKAAWGKVGAPVLVLQGAADYVIDPVDQPLIVAAVDAGKPGRATFKKIANLDHGYGDAVDTEESLINSQNATFNPVIVRELTEWMKSVPSRS